MVKRKRISGTKEWAHFTLSCYQGCDNNCSYCWAQADKIQKNKQRKPNKVTPENRHIPIKREWKNFTTAFRTGQREHGKESRIMFPGTHDITPKTIEYCLEALKHILDAPGSNHNVLIVSKPTLDCIVRLCAELEPYKDRIMFRFSIGSINDEVLGLWEPDAPPIKERLSSLKYAFDNGYKTSISCEPSLDEKVLALVEELSPYVNDYIWIGKANNFVPRLKNNGCDDNIHIKAAYMLIKLQTTDYISALYADLKDHPKVKWKDSIKETLGIPTNLEPGMDI